jgi:hypothetical protein
MFMKKDLQGLPQASSRLSVSPQAQNTLISLITQSIKRMQISFKIMKTSLMTGQAQNGL